MWLVVTNISYSPASEPLLKLESSTKKFSNIMAPSLPKSYKAAVFKAKGEPLTIEEIAFKEPIEGEILIKVLACGVCRSDEDVQQGIFGDLL